MNIDKLIGKLEQIRSKEGNIECWSSNYNDGYSESIIGDDDLNIINPLEKFGLDPEYYPVTVTKALFIGELS